MRILFTTLNIGSHFRPLLPFANGLKARGHEIRFAAIEGLSEEINGQGFDHLALDGPTDAQRAEFEAQVADIPARAVGKVYVRDFFMGILARAALPGLLRELEDWRPDLIVRESTEFSGLIAAEKLGILHARFEIINGESEESIATNYTEQIDALRVEFGLEPSGGGYLSSEPSFSAHPQVLDDTPRINGKAPIRFKEAASASSMEPEAPDWLPGDDRPLIYVTFGTIAAGSHRASQIYDTALQAVADLPVNVLMTTGRDAPEGLCDAVPPNVEIRAFVPQAQVLARAALMVCHGGSGTVLGGLEAGVPMVIAPLFADQPDNARCLQGAGLCLSVEDADAANLCDAIVTALADEALRQRAELAARDIAAMPTLDQALDQLLKI